MIEETGDDELEKALARLRGGGARKALPASTAPASSNDDGVDDALAKLRASGPPVAVVPGPDEPTVSPTLAKIRKEHRAGILSKRIARENLNDQEMTEALAGRSLPASALESFAATSANVAQGIPGMRAAQAGIGALSSHVIGDKPLSYRESLSRLDEATGKIPAVLRHGERIAGAVTLAGIPGMSALSLPRQGAIIGAADAAADADPTSIGQRGVNTVLGAGAGALGAKILQGGANLARRTGVTEVIAKGLRRARGAAADLGEAMGIKGAANAMLADRQRILDQLTGSEKSAAETMLNHVDDYKREAKRLYDVAREDQNAIESPAVKEILDNPLVQKAYEWGRQNYLARGNEIPTKVALKPGARIEADEPATRTLGDARTDKGRLKSLTSASDDELAAEYKALVDANAVENTAPTILEKRSWGEGMYVGMKGAAARALGRIKSRNQSIKKIEAEMERRGTDPMEAYKYADETSFEFGANVSKDVVPTVTAGGEEAVELPTPELLAITKRGLEQIAKGIASSSAVSREEAMTTLPLLDRLRSALHEASEPWKVADHFYAQAKNFESAFERAFGAQQRPTASGLSPLKGKTKTPEAIRSWIESTPNLSTRIARRSGAQAGAAGRLAEDIRNAPLAPTVSGMLSSAGQAFEPSVSAANVRRMAFPDDESAMAFADLLGQIRAKGGLSEAVSDVAATLPNWRGRRVLSVLRANNPGNPLDTPEGQRVLMTLSQQLATPAQRDAVMAAVRRGQSGRKTLDLLRTAGLLAANSPLAP